MLGILLKDLLNDEQKIFIKSYEDYLHNYKRGYSFLWDYQKPSFRECKNLRRIKSTLGFLPKQELLISGLADPMFRAAEQLMKNLDGYYIHNSDTRLASDIGIESLLAENRNCLDESRYIYLVNWKFFEIYFNRLDDESIKKIYNIAF